MIKLFQFEFDLNTSLINDKNQLVGQKPQKQYWLLLTRLLNVSQMLILK